MLYVLSVCSVSLLMVLEKKRGRPFQSVYTNRLLMNLEKKRGCPFQSVYTISLLQLQWKGAAFFQMFIKSVTY